MPAPPAPAVPRSFGLTDALRNKWAVAEGALVTSEVFLWRAPSMILPHLARYCTTPVLRGALVGACAASWLVVIPIVGLLSTQVRTRWQESIFEQRSQQFIDCLRSRPDLYPKVDLKNAIASELADEGAYLAQQYSQFLTMVLSCLAQVTAVLLQISTIPLGWPLYAALAGVACIAWLSRNVGEESIDGQTAAVREARLHLANSGLEAWDNLVLGNRSNSLRWGDQYQQNTKTYFAEFSRGRFGAQLQQLLFSLQWMLQSSLSASTAMYATCFPERGPLLSSSQHASMVNLASLLSVAVQFTPLSRQYKDLKAKRARSDEHLRQIYESGSLAERIQGQKINVQSPQGEFDGDACLQDFERLAAPGLHTVRGANGAGKTLMLLEAKKYFSDRALYVPAAHNLNFPIERGSSGQNVERLFDRLDQHEVMPEILLLDEWDANLDDNVRDRLSDLIKGWAKDHAVVQIVHR